MKYLKNISTLFSLPLGRNGVKNNILRMFLAIGEQRAKAGWAFVMLLLMAADGIGQNLVPNPSFEDTAYCVTGPTDIEAALGWESYADSPDYFNLCTSNSDVSVPNNWGGISNQQVEMLTVL